MDAPRGPSIDDERLYVTERRAVHLVPGDDRTAVALVAI
jgi:hypothetical protein